jgi:hypothetical protein
MSEASGSFLKKRTKKLLLIAGIGNFGARKLRRSNFNQGPRHVMAGLDPAIHAFPPTPTSHRPPPVIASAAKQSIFGRPCHAKSGLLRYARSDALKNQIGSTCTI